MVGAPAYPGGSNSNNTGAAFLINASLALDKPILIGSYGTENTEENRNMQFGSTVDLVGDLVFIAAPAKKINGTQAGSLFIYQLSQSTYHTNNIV